jgi:hypothetical protein
MPAPGVAPSQQRGWQQIALREREAHRVRAMIA